jgi:hypothetical protein
VRILPLAVVLALVVGAARARAFPVSYAFSVGSLAGSFSYDGATGIGTLAYSASYLDSAVFDLGSTGIASLGTDLFGNPSLRIGTGADVPGWPAVYDAFPVTATRAAVLVLSGGDLLDGDELRHGLTLADLASAQLEVVWFFVDASNGSPYLLGGCPAGTLLPDCPPSSYLYRDSSNAPSPLTDLHEIPEPAVAVLALVALAAALAKRRAPEA